MSITLVLFLFFLSLISNLFLFNFLVKEKLKNNKLEIELKRLKYDLQETRLELEMVQIRNIERKRVIEAVNKWKKTQPKIISESLYYAVYSKKTINANNIINISDYQQNKK